MPAILFVCTANRFRSPIAEASFKRELRLRGMEADWRVLSAGTWTTDGLPAAADAISAASRMGLDVSGHTSRAITPQLLRDSDLVVVMEQGQKEALQSEFPESAQKVRVLSEVSTGVPYDIPDPSGSMSVGEIPNEIDHLIHAGFDRICAIVASR